MSINKSDFGSHAIAYVPIETQQELGNLIQQEQNRIRDLKRQIVEAEQNVEASVYEAFWVNVTQMEYDEYFPKGE